MATRLERLWVLLDSGSTPVTRKAAAVQIGEIQKLHPHELKNLLKKVSGYLNSKSWDTRIAAGQAVEAIASNVKQWEPGFQTKSESPTEAEGEEEDSSKEPEYLTFDTFDIKKVLEHGTPLLSSTGDEFQGLESDPDFQKLTPQERLALQRKQLEQRLGLSAQGKMFSVGMEHLFEDSDLMTSPLPSPGVCQETKRGTVKELSALQLSGLSAREKNLAKRKAKLNARRASVDTESKGKSECDSPPHKKLKTVSVVVEQGKAADKILIDQVTNAESAYDESMEWPFTLFCEELFHNLFNPSWEVRHGAATALREVVKAHGHTAGITGRMPPHSRPAVNQKWLADAAIRVLCVFSLDRFADFVSDQVVAPVRATCAQVLGVVSRLMTEENIVLTTRVLLLLAGQGQWEVRHASLMGIQHLLAARTDLCPLLLPSLYPSVLRGLQDSDDDVRAIAAASLLPVSSHLTSLLTQQVPGLLSVLWDSLLYLDDLSASTNSIMELMGTLLSFNYSSSSDSLSHTSSVTLEKLVPRLWPFLGHNISSVRKSSLQAIMTLLTLDEVEAASSSGDASDPVPSGGGGSNEGKAWLVQLLQPFLCQIFQRFLLEGDQQNRKLLQDVWSSIISQSSAARLQAHVSPLMWSWLCLLVASSSSPVDTNLLVPSVPGGLVSSCLYLGGGTGVESVSEKDQMALLARLAGTRALGVLAHKLSAHTQSANGTTPTTGVPSQPVSQDALSSLVAGLKRLLSSGVSLHRIVSVLVICHWQDCPHQDTLGPALLSALTDTTGLEDMLPYIVAMQRDCQSLIMALERHGQEVVKDVPLSSYNAEFATKLASTTYQNAMASLEVGVADRQELEACQRSLVGSISRLQEEHQRVTTRVSVCVSGALVSLQLLPDKLTPMIRPLMDCIKTEADPLIQELAAKWLSQLVGLCRNRKPSPMSKIIKNLCLFACCDPHCTPGMLPPEDRAGSTLSHRKGKTSKSGGPLESQGGARDGGSPPIEADWRENSAWKWNSGIISLVRLKRDGAFSKLPAPSRGRPSTAMKETMATALAMENQRKAMSCQRRGAEMALVQLSQHFKESLFKTVPNLWAHIHSPLTELPESPANVEEEDGSNPEESVASQVQVIVSSLHILEVIAPVLTTPNVPQTLLPLILPALYSPFTSIRHMAARGVACLCDMDLHFTMEAETYPMNLTALQYLEYPVVYKYLLAQHVVTEVLPWLGASSSLPHRQGAIEAVHCVLERLGLRGLVYVVLLLMPVLGTMSDQDNKVRLMASRVFAELVTLMPLESGAVTPPEMSASLAGKRDSDRHFIEQLLDTSKLDSYVVPVAIKADLRKYQQDGINWLAFLNRYKLHGILCDDMGLGKTLQSLCMIAGDHHIRTQAFKETSQVDSQPLPSLVVCPPTLTGHWVYEVRKFCELKDLDPLQYTGPPSVRARLQQQVLDHDLVVASYDIVRNDIDFFKTVHWNYCVLDEGHIIKNTRTQITRAIKQLKANHRLILSGTPIQNNVLELWSLFDFLMPGFLGTEKQFYEKFGRPIIMSRDAKSSSREQEAGALAMESLHRQVLPFLLRRMKEDVLQDLPPKIIQDYYCELSPLQVKLYEDFAKTQAKKKVEKDLVEGGDTMEEEEEATGDFTHIFQALQYLRKVCNHPALVVKPEHPMYSKVQDFLLKDSSVITDIKHAAKLQALRQLLLDCNIGDRPGGSEDAEGVACLSAVSQHRALIFCQYKSMLDIIEQDLLKAHMPSVTYLRLDGSVASWSRFGIVNKFNSDPSVDVLLLTTHVGGLGLNLTGADTVIFFEHDWNPMKDLQAMDRAHRIGQKKVVNVYRLITKGTLEEKIMSLQKFKLNIANTVISQDNSSLQAMNTSDLLDLFQISGTSNHRGNKKGEAKEGGANRSSGGMKKILENLPELWDDKQYTDEYDLSGFMKTLKDTH